jgi:hypothetical protein
MVAALQRSANRRAARQALAKAKARRIFFRWLLAHRKEQARCASGSLPMLPISMKDQPPALTEVQMLDGEAARLEREAEINQAPGFC